MRDVDFEGRARGHELRMASRSAGVAVRCLKCREMAVYPGDTSLYNELFGRRTLWLDLGWGVYSCPTNFRAAEHH